MLDCLVSLPARSLSWNRATFPRSQGGASLAPAEAKAFPESFFAPFGEKFWSMTPFGLVLFAALSSPWNSPTCLSAPAGGSEGASGSEGVPRKSPETIR
eukprot:7213761-Pyramimonas_sp.AAC.1